MQVDITKTFIAPIMVCCSFVYIALLLNYVLNYIQWMKSKHYSVFIYRVTYKQVVTEENNLFCLLLLIN